MYLQKIVPGLRRFWSQLSIQDIFLEGLVSGCEDPLLVEKILVTVVSPNICATSATVRTVLNIQASSSVPVDDLPSQKFPLLPLHSVASVHLHLVVISAIFIVVGVLIQTFS